MQKRRESTTLLLLIHIPGGLRFSTCRETQLQHYIDHHHFTGTTKYGMPIHCVSDNGPQFRSEEFAHFLKMNGVKHVRVAPYHAASNGLAERMVQSFKNHMKMCKGSKLSIQQRIENFLLMYQSTKHPTAGRTPASLFLGRELRTWLTLLCPNVEEKFMDSQAKQKANTTLIPSSESSTQVTESS